MRVKFVSKYGQEEVYNVSDKNNPGGNRVRYFDDGRGVYNDYNKNLPAEYLEAVIAFKKEES